MPKIYKNGIKYQDNASITNIEYVNLEETPFETIYNKLQDLSKLVIGYTTSTSRMYCSFFNENGIVFSGFFDGSNVSTVIKHSDGTLNVFSDGGGESGHNKIQEITYMYSDENHYPSAKAVKDYVDNNLPTYDNTTITLNSEGKISVAYKIFKSAVEPTVADGNDGDIGIKYTAVH